MLVRCNMYAGTVLYEYVDLWSRASTWGGGPLPVGGDSIVIPANTTVLLDVPSPRLVSLVLQGTLKFDDQFSPSQVYRLLATTVKDSVGLFGTSVAAKI